MGLRLILTFKYGLQNSIGPFVAKASDEQIRNMTDKLADFLMEEKVKDEQREISSYGLQTVIHSVNPRCGNLLVDRLARRIMGVLQNEVPLTLITVLDLKTNFGLFCNRVQALRSRVNAWTV